MGAGALAVQVLGVDDDLHHVAGLDVGVLDDQLVSEQLAAEEPALAGVFHIFLSLKNA